MYFLKLKYCNGVLFYLSICLSRERERERERDRERDSENFYHLISHAFTLSSNNFKVSQNFFYMKGYQLLFIFD